MYVITIQWLHFEDQISTVSVHLRCLKDATIGLKTTTSFMPATAIKGIEVVPPVQIKLIEQWIEHVGLNIVILAVPRHIHWIETCVPWGERRSPEVHSERLGLVQSLDSWESVSFKMADLMSIDRVRNVVGSPLKGVCMPVIKINLWEEMLVLQFVLPVAVNKIR